MSSPSAVPCREIFDENSQPSAEEISEYAQQLGIDPESESHLLPLARDGLMQALPSPWKAYYDDKLQTHYYYNDETKKTQWEHPLDNVYRELVKKARDASMHDDTCASVQELPTSEENTKNLERVETKAESDEEFSTDSENHPSDVRDSTLAGARRLAPLGRPPLAPLTRLDKKLNDTRISSLRRSVDGSLSGRPTLMRNTSDRDILNRTTFERPKLLHKQQSEIIDLKMHVLNSPEEEKFSPLLTAAKIDKELPLTGKGTMFLRTAKSDLPSPDTDKSLPLESMTKSDPPKGILREKLSDSSYRKPDGIASSRHKQAASFEEAKSVRFKLENVPDPTLSPGSNSSSEPNDGQSSIISAPHLPVPSAPSLDPPTIPTVLSLKRTVSSTIGIVPPTIETIPSVTSTIGTVTSTIGTVTSIIGTVTSTIGTVTSTIGAVTSTIGTVTQTIGSVAPLIGSHSISQIVLSPLKTRPPLPPRPNDSPRELKSISGSEKDSFESESRESVSASPRRRVVRPPAADYIKPDLFQKNFHKISDLVRPGDIETTSVHLEEPVLTDKEARPRSPMIPLKSKISINLMESIESETSIDSPDREFANLDLNDLDDSNDKDKFIETVNDDNELQKNEENSDKIVNSSIEKSLCSENQIPKIKISTLDISKSTHSDSDESKKISIHEDELKSHELSDKKSPQIKTSSTPSVSFELKSPKLDFTKTWSPLSNFRHLNKTIISPQLKTSDSANSIGKSFASPRLDGVILSQGKSSTDNVVVVYQFETPEEPSKTIKSPLIPDMGTRDLFERNKADERRRLDLALQKELESMRMEWSTRERKLRADLQDELKDAEEKFLLEKRTRLNEQTERHRRELEEAVTTAECNHKHSLEKATNELEEKHRAEIEAAQRQHAENMNRLQEQYRARLAEQQHQLEIDNERALSDLRDQLKMSLSRERTRLIEENRATIESLRDEHTSRVTDLRHDYRAEVERLRTQHACHVEEVRARLAGERAAAARAHDLRPLQEKYKCLKEKYARLKHDVKMSIERRNKRREMSMTTGSETEKSNSHKANQSLERCKEVNETSVSAIIEAEPARVRVNNNGIVNYNDNETSYSESNAHRPFDNNNDEWRLRRDNTLPSADTSQASAVRQQRPYRRTTVAFREPPRRKRERDRDTGANTDCQDSSDATTADEKPKENVNGHGRRRCFTRLKSASTSRLNYSPKRGEGWSSPLESLRQQLRKLDDLEDQFPDLALQPAYSLRYPFTELGAVAKADTPELEFVRHRALVEREGMRRARAVLKRRKAALRETRASLSPHRAPSEEREVTELEVALHRARALLGEKEIRLRHIERALRKFADSHPPPLIQETTTSEASSGSEAAHSVEAGGAVLRSLRALHADVRDIWRALDARRPYIASPETSSYNAATTSQARMTLSAPEPIIQDNSDGGVAERARGLRAWLQTAP